MIYAGLCAILAVSTLGAPAASALTLAMLVAWIVLGVIDGAILCRLLPPPFIILYAIFFLGALWFLTPARVLPIPSFWGAGHPVFTGGQGSGDLVWLGVGIVVLGLMLLRYSKGQYR